MKHITLLTLLLLPLTTHAELPPEAYADMQARAPEHLTIEVIEVDTSICWLWLCSGRDVDVRARVVTVHRTATGLTPGDTLRIRYRHVPLGDRAGPSAIPILDEGTTTHAWLARDKDTYATAARGYSFAPPVPLRAAPTP